MWEYDGILDSKRRLSDLADVIVLVQLVGSLSFDMSDMAVGQMKG